MIGRFFWVLRVLLSHWRRRPVPLLALLSGLMLATALWSGVQALNAQARDSYARAAAQLGGPQAVRIRRPDGVTIDEAWFVTLRRAGWPVSPVVEGRVRVGNSRVTLLGIDPLTLPRGAAGQGAGAALPPLFGPEARGLAAPETLAALGLAESDLLPAEVLAPLPPLAAVQGLAPGTVLLDISFAQPALGLEGRLTRLIAPADLLQDEAALTALVGEALVLDRGDAGADLSRLTASFHLNLTAFGLLAFAVGLFIVHGAVGLAFEQRVAMLRTLRACGVGRGALAVALIAELAGFALVAGAAGMVLGYGIAALLLPDVAATLRGLYGAPVPGELSLRPSWWVSGMAISLGGAMLAAGGGILKGWSLPVLAPAMPVAWRAAQGAALRWQGIGGLGLIAVAAVAAGFGDGMIAGFVAMGGLLVGAALLLPVALALILRGLARPVRQPVAHWVLADAQQSLGGLSLALMALMLALAANIGVGTMVGSFRGTFIGWLDQRLAAEVYARADDADTAADFEALAPGVPGVVAVLPSREVEVQIGGGPVEVLGLIDHPTYRDAWPMIAALPGVWDTLAAGEGSLVSEQTARRLRLSLGDRLLLPGSVEAWPVTVVGLYPDYGNPRGQVVVNHAAHAERFPQARRGSWGVRVARGETAAVLDRLGDAVPGIELIDQAGIRQLSLAIFDQTFRVTGALNALTFGVAGVALLTSLTTLGTMRLPQLAPLWAMGLTRRQLAGMEFARTLALAALTAVLALPLGVTLAWVLLAVVNVQAFGWRLPLVLFPADWLWLGLLAILAAALAAAWPTWRLARIAPARLVQVFAAER